jgi:hypothetical protein
MSAASSPSPNIHKREFQEIYQQVHVVIPLLRRVDKDPPATDLHSYVRDFFPPSPPPLTLDVESDFSRLSPTLSPNAHDAHDAHDEPSPRVPTAEKACCTPKRRGCTFERRPRNTGGRVRSHSMLTRQQRKLQRRAESLLELSTSGQPSKARYPKKPAR